MNNNALKILQDNLIVINRKNLKTFIEKRLTNTIQIKAHKFNPSVLIFQSNGLEYIHHNEEDIDLQGYTIAINEWNNHKIIEFLSINYSDNVGILLNENIIRFQMDNPESDDPSYFELKISCNFIPLED